MKDGQTYKRKEIDLRRLYKNIFQPYAGRFKWGILAEGSP